MTAARLATGGYLPGSRLGKYDCPALGSAVYMGHWLEPARRLVDQHGAALAARPTWLFSSGPVGDPPKPDEEPVDVAALVAATDARDHQVFAGRLDRDLLGFAERAVMIALRAPQGDLRDWADPRLGPHASPSN